MTPSAKLRESLRGGAALAALILAAGVAAPAFAQDTQTTLEDVIVTAQKRAENIQEVPVSVATLSGERLTAIFAGGEDVLALSSRVPGLYAESSNGRVAPRFYIRGLGNSDFDVAASQPVSIIQDDGVRENVVLKSWPIHDVAQVEGLRGPQGTLFGRNTTAGIVKFATAKPTQTFGATGTATYGTYGSYTLDGGVGGALIADKLSARASLLIQHREDYIDNTFTGVKDALGGYDELAARVQFLYTPTENFSALLNVHNRQFDGTSALFRANIVTKGSNAINGNFDRDSVAFNGGGNNPQKYDGNGTSLKMDYDFGDVTLTSITAYETTNGYSRGDIDGGAAGVGPGFIPFDSDTQDSIADLNQVTQELRLASDDTEKVTWQVGAFYFKSDFLVTTAPGFVPPSTLKHENTSWAVFGQGSYAVSDDLKLTAGIRYTSDEKDLSVTKSPFGTGKAVSVSDEEISWDLSAFYDLSDDVSVYGRVARGFRGPSIQGRDIAFGAPSSVAQSETILSWEAGVKSELLDRTLRLNGAVFTYTVDDPQFSAIGGVANSNRLINAKKAEAYGVELDGEWAVTPNLVLTAGYSYAHTEIKDSTLAVAVCGSGQCTPTDPLTVGGAAKVGGNPFPNAPEYVLNFTARYSYPMGDGELFAFTDWFRQGHTNFFLYETKEFFSEDTFEGGLKLGYAKSDGAYEVALFARNITDEVNLKGGIDFNNNTGFVNEPRVIGISLSARR